MTIQYKVNKLLDSGKLRFFLINKKNENYNKIKQEIVNSTYFLPLNSGLSQRIWHIKNNTTNIPTCPECGKNVKFKGIGKGGYAEFCSSKCSNHSEINNEKRRITSLKKFGAENVSQTKYFEREYKKTMKRKYGVDHYSKTKEYKEKVKTALNERYGVDNIMKNKKFSEEFFERYKKKTGFDTPLNNPEVREKIKETLEEVYGVNHNFKIPEVIEKREKTWIKNYGVDHPMKNIFIFYKLFYNYRDYIFPSGRIERIQGYEDKAIDELLDNGVKENDIIINDIEIQDYIGEIYYFYEEKTRRYYPDIFIKSQNKIIEVKSDYTFEKDKEKNIEKEKAVIKLGINFEFKIY